MLSKSRDLLLRLERKLFVFEEWALVAGLVIMIVAGTMQVVLRNFFNTGVEWADILVRSLVLWVGFLGASLATRKAKHINIEIVSKIITNPTLAKIRLRTVLAISLALTITLLKIAIDYTIIEAGNNMYAFLRIPTWMVFIIVPISLFLIALRLLIELLLGEPIEKEVLSNNEVIPQ